ncbi:hypothetical protein H0H92_009826 [Tricholoma furcatifolium]|nr:hypothetical protein H0H92_009826 [Tricholoma furcatifolium]
MTSADAALIPQRQIRALYDSDTVTVYQAYSSEIAIPAVETQNLAASPAFKFTRMTWVKPSWCWMMYRAGYSFKDPNQSRILAIKMKHEHFKELLSQASVTSHGHLTDEEKARPVRVQWDPERSPSLGVLPYRSIQIGISGALSRKWVEEWIAGIEDVTDMARGLRDAVESKGKEGKGVEWTVEELVERGLVPREKVYEVGEELRRTLKMDVDEER